jgi:hypothetical protein
MKLSILSLIVISMAGSLIAQNQSTVNAPVSGYVFDKEAAGLRPVLGLPGAALLGSPVNLGFGVAAAFVAPRLDSALVIAADNGMHWFRVRNGAFTETQIDGLSSAGQVYSAVFSPAGTAAAIYNSGSLQIVTGLPDSPAVAITLDLSASSTPDAMAVSDDAQAILVSADHAIRLFGPYADLGKLMDSAGGPVMAFATGSHDAAVGDSGAGLVLFHDLTGAGDSHVVAAPDDSTASLSALAFSTDAKAIFLASSAAQAVTRFDLAAAARSRIPCSCAPTSLARMGGVFRLTELTADPLWLLDAPEADPRVVFVPALTP